MQCTPNPLGHYESHFPRGPAVVGAFVTMETTNATLFALLRWPSREPVTRCNHESYRDHQKSRNDLFRPVPRFPFRRGTFCCSRELRRPLANVTRIIYDYRDGRPGNAPHKRRSIESPPPPCCVMLRGKRRRSNSLSIGVRASRNLGSPEGHLSGSQLGSAPVENYRLSSRRQRSSELRKEHCKGVVLATACISLQKNLTGG